MSGKRSDGTTALLRRPPVCWLSPARRADGRIETMGTPLACGPAWLNANMAASLKQS